MWRNIASNALTLFVVVLIAVGGVIAWGQNQFSAPGPLAQPMCVKVDRGATIGKLSEQLAALQAISSPYVFRIGADYTDKAGGLKFGSYLVPAAASMEQILGLVTGGGQSTCGVEINYRIGVVTSALVLSELDPATNALVEVAKFDPGTEEAPAEYVAVQGEPDVRLRVTLAEGVTSWQVVQALKAWDVLSGDVKAVPAEGTLAPFSYDVVAGDGREALLSQMTTLQSQILADLWAGRAADLPIKTPEEALILASIIEKETGVAQERERVASIFVNRLREGMRLQTDPTVIYGITNGEAVLGRGLRQSELRRETPYNTYVIVGLPPTPIANPGRASIEAALHPEESDYLYFVADGTGGHAFARTLTEHNENVAKWRAIEAERAAEPAAP